MLNFNVSFGRARVVAVVDMSPGGATVSIISCPKDAPATILASGRSALSLEARTSEQESGLIGEQVKQAAEHAQALYAATKSGGAISEVYAIVHAPWARTSLVTAEEKYESETRIQGARIEALAKSAINETKDIDPARLLESSVIRVALNGYPTPAPEGKSAHTLKITAIASDCDDRVRQAVEGALHASFPVARVSWRSGLRALMTVARESLASDPFLVVDMGASNTHIASISDSSLSQLAVPEGTRTILARIAASRTADEVLGLVRMLSRDACSSEACDSLRTAIASTEPELVRLFGEAMAKIAEKSRVPNEVLLLVHPDLESWLTTFLARIDFAQFTITSMPLAVRSAASLDLSRWVIGAQDGDVVTIGAALVNIESRA